MKKKIEDYARLATFVLPVGWTVSCLEGAWATFESGRFLRFILHIFSGCVIALVLVHIGAGLAGFEIDTEKRPPYSPVSVLLGEIFALMCISYMIAARS